MKLPFRYQFVLAPMIIVVLLACLVAYTFVEFAGIKRANKRTLRWQIVTDQIQVAITGAMRLRKITLKLSSIKDLQQHDDYFDYIEKTKILSNSLTNPYLLWGVPKALSEQLRKNEKYLQEPDKIRPLVINRSLGKLIPALEYQYKLFAAERRTAYITYHRSLKTINSRMTTVLLTVLILCISLALAVGLWSLKTMRSRLRKIAQNASQLCEETGNINVELKSSLDELDELEAVLMNVTSELVSSAGAENLMLGAENERRRIAMDMHDGVLVDLTRITRCLDEFQTEQDLTKQKIVKQLRMDVDQVIESLRCAIDDLHPQVLEILGMEAALRSFLSRHSASSFPNCHLEYDVVSEEYFCDSNKINIFRIVIEAINNAFKHAQCDRIDISLRNVNQSLIITVEDNGIGLADGDKISVQGHGLPNIRQRANMIGAAAEWRASRYSTGTCFELKLSHSNTGSAK